MTRKRIAIVLGMVSLIGFLILRWIQRTPTEADDRDHPAEQKPEPLMAHRDY